MKILFLGTAAFEGIPALFCTCELCEKSRRVGGKNIRSRTSIIIDDELKIDFPPDSFYHMVQYDLNFEKIKDILITHSHSDHLYVDDLVARFPGYSQSEHHSINIYGNDVVIEKCKKVFRVEGGAKDKFTLNNVQAFNIIHLSTSIVVPLLAVHDPNENCFLYYIEKEGKTILYGHDSGWFAEETLEWLKGKKLDVVILECTMGKSDYQQTHMNIDAVIKTKSFMEKYHIIDENSQIIVTHFSHNAQLMHKDLCDIFTPYQIITAYDGMVLDL